MTLGIFKTGRLTFHVAPSFLATDRKRMPLGPHTLDIDCTCSPERWKGETGIILYCHSRETWTSGE